MRTKYFRIDDFLSRFPELELSEDEFLYSIQKHVVGDDYPISISIDNYPKDYAIYKRKLAEEVLSMDASTLAPLP